MLIILRIRAKKEKPRAKKNYEKTRIQNRNQRNTGNRFEGNWEQGTEMKFFDAKNNGMFNLVETNVLQKVLQMKHLGWIMNGELSPQGWEESNISYPLHPIENGTELKVNVNSLDEFVDFYSGYVPKIFEKIKDLAEN